jgi:hypothetical protein
MFNPYMCGYIYPEKHKLLEVGRRETTAAQWPHKGISCEMQQ